MKITAMEAMLKENKSNRQETTLKGRAKVKQKLFNLTQPQKVDAIYENLFTPVQ